MENEYIDVNPLDIIINFFNNPNNIGKKIVVYNEKGTWHTYMHENKFVSSTEDDDTFESDSLNGIIGFFDNTKITEIDQFDLNGTNHIELYICEGDNCYYERSKKSDIIKKKWKSYKFNQGLNQGFLKNQTLRELNFAPPGSLNSYFPGGSGYHSAISGFYSFGKKNFLLKRLNKDIKYLLT